MGRRSQPLTSCVIRFHFINGLMRDRFAGARRGTGRADPSAPLRSSWVANRWVRADQGARPSCLDAERPGGYTVAAGASGGRSCSGKGVASVWSVFKFAARAAIWRPTPNPPLVGLSTLVGWTLVLALVRGGIQLLDAIPSPVFNPYGINALIAWLVIAIAVAAFFVRPGARMTFLSAMVALSVLTEVVLSAIRLGLALVLPPAPIGLVLSLFPALSAHGLTDWAEGAISISFFLAPLLSWIGGMFAIIRG